MDGYIPKDKRKKILLLCDEIRMQSGIATMAREIVIGTAHRYNWFNVGGAAVAHGDTGKVLDLSPDVNKHAGITDSDVKLLCVQGYGNHDLITAIMKQEKPDAIFIFTDPRYWIWLFEMENEIRTKIPIIYLNIWDDLPAPMYNRSYYDSCDALLCISKQTKNIVNMVLGDRKKGKLIEYVPHGINKKYFYPIDKNNITEYDKLLAFKDTLFNKNKPEFVALFNSRNLTRKGVSNLILGYQVFCEKIGKEKAKKCVLVLHTDPVDPNGTDLPAVIEALTDHETTNITISAGKIDPIQLNMLYNLCDVVIQPSSAEGWGLSVTEGLHVGKMVIATVTGGLQDQMRFEDEDGNWIDFNENFCSNQFGTYKNHGEWARPVFPQNMSIVGSPITPYIFDDRTDFREIAQAIEDVYNLSPEERERRGQAGREWVLSEESQMSSDRMCESIIKNIDKTLETWTPRKRYSLYPATVLPRKKVPHKILY